MSAQLYKALCSRLLQTDFTKHEELCCLCLKPAGEDATSVDDEVVLSLGTKQQPIRKNIWNILKLVLDESFTEVMYILTLVCKECMNSAIASYKFIKGCKTNVNILHQALEKLEDSFDVTDDAFNYKTMYVAIHPEEISKKSLIRRYYDKKCHFIPQDTALPRFQMILESQHPKTSLCSKTDIESTDILFDPEKPNDYKCIFCQQQFTDSACLRIHFFRKHHHKSDVKCKECNRFSIIQFNLDNNFDGDCTVVEEAYIDPQTNQEYLEYMGSPESVPAPDFDETPMDSEAVLINTAAQLEEVSSEQIYTCFDCDRTYKDFSVYTRHKKRRCKKEKQGVFYCDHCKRKFSYKTSLSQHIQNQHMTTKSHLCELCGKNFSRNSLLQTHIKTYHTNEQKKKSVCPHCGKSFRMENHLRLHLEIHSEVRPYTCDMCDQPFKTQAHLRSHVIQKHQAPKVKCNLCECSYHTQGELARHKKTHSNYKEKPSNLKYICEYCNRGFNTGGKLTDHVRRHEPPAEECDICHRKFRARTDLRRHRTKHYNVNSRLYKDRPKSSRKRSRKKAACDQNMVK